MECVILVGLPGSGKTTFFRERFAATYDHVSKDVLRNNRRPARRQERLLDESLAAGRSVVVDNTNPTRADRVPLIAAARRHGAEVAGYYFATDARLALRRNRARAGRARVPDVAVYTTRKRLELPSYAEGFDRLYVVVADEETRTFAVMPQERRSEH